MLADAYADLAARQAELTHDGFYPAEFDAEFEQIDHEELRADPPTFRQRWALRTESSLDRGNFRRRSRL